MRDVHVFKIVPAEGPKNFAELSFLNQCFLVDPISVLLALEHLSHHLQAYVSTQFLSFPCHDLHEFIELKD